MMFLLCQQRCTNRDLQGCQVVSITSEEGFDDCPACGSPMTNVDEKIRCANCDSDKDILRHPPSDLYLCVRCSDALKNVGRDLKEAT